MNNSDLKLSVPVVFTFLLSFLKLLYKLGQWSQFFWVNKLELVNEIDEVLEAGVKMCLSWQKHDMLEMSMVDVSIDSEQALEDNFYDVHEILWEWNTNLAGKDFLIIKLVLNPSHKEINVFWCWYLEWSLHIVTISPEVLIFGSSWHSWTRFCSAELC